MSKYTHHTNCDNCGSRDNKAVYEDGHSYCFGCRQYIPGKESIHKVHDPTLWINAKVKDFPWDATQEIPSEPLQWLLQYGITQHEANTKGIYWSPYRRCLCWQVKSPRDAILGWSSRNFAPDAASKATHTGELRDDINIVGVNRPAGFCDDGDDKIVLVEDYISAIKVGTIIPAMCLYGCTINSSNLLMLSKHFKGVILWLDSDKLDNAREIALRASSFGLTGQVLYTEEDPKCYSLKEIEYNLKTLN